MSAEKGITVSRIAELVGGRVEGDGSVLIEGAASIEAAGPGKVSFLGNPGFKDQAMKSNAGAMITSGKLPAGFPQIIVDDPYTAFVKVVEALHPEERFEPGVHQEAVVEEGARLGKDVHVGAFAYVAASADIGDGSVICEGTVVGARCRVGADTVIRPRVTLYPGVSIGSGCIIHSGTIIGSDGFGFILSEEGHVKKPQVGSVVIEDRVEIGANCTIDRAMLDATVVGEGTKLDNLVHLAHNVVVGKHCLIMAGVMVGGSTTIGDFCVISGNSTIRDNLSIGSRVMVVGHSAVAEDVHDNQTVFGYPAMPFSHAKRVYSRLKQLPDLFKRMRSVEKAVAPRSAEEDEY